MARTRKTPAPKTPAAPARTQYLKFQRIANGYALFLCTDVPDTQPEFKGQTVTRRQANTLAESIDGPTEIARVGQLFVVFATNDVALPECIDVVASRRAALKAASAYTESNPDVLLRKRATSDDE